MPRATCGRPLSAYLVSDALSDSCTMPGSTSDEYHVGLYLGVNPEGRYRRSSRLVTRSSSRRLVGVLPHEQWLPLSFRQLLAPCKMPQPGVVFAERLT